MQTEAFICYYLNKDVAGLVITYLKSDKNDEYSIAKNGFYEECLNIGSSLGLCGAIDGQHEHIVKLIVSPDTIFNIGHYEKACGNTNLNIVRLICRPYMPPIVVDLCVRAACDNGSVDILQLLLYNFKPNKMDDYLDICYGNKNNEKIRVCLEQDAIYYVDHKKSLLDKLHKACAEDNLNLVKLIHEYAGQYELDLNALARVARTADILQHILKQNKEIPYDSLFHTHATIHMPYFLCGKIRQDITQSALKAQLLLPHMSRNALYTHMRVYTNVIYDNEYDGTFNKTILRLVQRELFLRAIKN